MKLRKNFPIFIVLLGMFMLQACEDEQIVRDKLDADEAIILRSCTVTCPTGDCCCFVELQNPETESADLELCGTSNGSDGCTGSSVGNCSSFSGGFQEIFLDDNNPRMGFCMDENAPFWIANTSASNAANIYLSCQGGELSPQILTITIPAQEKWYYETDGDCELTECE